VTIGTVTLIGPIAAGVDDQMTFTAVHEVKGELLGQRFDEVFDSVE
jgi:hypothetical protein